MKGKKASGPSVDALLREVAALTARLAQAEDTIIALRGDAENSGANQRPARNAPGKSSRLESMVRERTQELEILTGELHGEIRDRIETEKALLAEKAYRDAVENCLATGIVATDPNGRHTHANDAFCAMVGFRREDLLGAGIPYPYWPSEEREAYAAAIRKVLQGEIVPGGLEFRFRKHDGQILDVLMYISPMTVGGKVIGSLASVYDITDRKRIESALRDSEEKLRIGEERFRQLFEQNEEPLFLFRGGSAEILDVNPAAVQLYGYPREELLRGGLSLFVQPGDRPELLSAISGMQFDTILSVERATHLRSDGERIFVSLRGKSICTESGHVVYCSVRDITTRIRMEEDAKLHQAQLIHANRMTSLGTMVSGVAHEINNPNNLVMFNAPLIHSAWEDALPVLDAFFRENGDFSLGGLPYSEMKEVVPKMAAGISDASARIKAIVENLKDFARQDTSRHQAAVRINDVVRMAVTFLNHEILRATRRFEVANGEDLPQVMGSAQRLEQVVINLLNNAFQALPSNRHGIRVTTCRGRWAGEVEVRVEDEGVGMSTKVLERIKEPFFSTHLDSGGLGLGVSICQSIIQEHRGTLEFESEVGKGTRAIVRLPGIGNALGIGGEGLSSEITSER